VVHDPEGPSLYEAIIVKADLQSSHLLGPTWAFADRRAVTVKGGRRPSRSDLP
jgi:hypothetical protein